MEPGILRGVNAEPLLTEIAAAIRDVKLEAVMIGNAASALQGAPVTTVDFDFLFRPTARNLTKLKRPARRMRLAAVARESIGICVS
jgi:hypothetical protein